ncbi:CHAT domain-containing protein [Streptosporangiaceae bacterium NEAU-GS5]|nr:CHAT domain-containing protein [Streptosporangiaceae bacterium NEAU-GS5]
MNGDHIIQHGSGNIGKAELRGSGDIVAGGRPPVGDRSQDQDRSAAVPDSTILFLTADPTDANRLRLGEELREIQEKLQLSRLRARFRLEQRPSVRPLDITQALLDVQPSIVHFSGHGTAAGRLCVENSRGRSHPLAPEALSDLFKNFAGHVRCVVLNACYSAQQAEAIAAHIDYVIGISDEIGDRAGIAFATGFYQALGGGRSIEDAFDLGRTQIRLLGSWEHSAPVLMKKHA